MSRLNRIVQTKLKPVATKIDDTSTKVETVTSGLGKVKTDLGKVNNSLNTKASTSDLQKVSTKVGTIETYVSKKLGLPNWDTSKGQAITSGSKIPSDGWILCTSDPVGNNWTVTREVRVNGVLVVRFQQWEASGIDSMDFQPSVVPVAKNDVVTLSDDACFAVFYPAK